MRTFNRGSRGSSAPGPFVVFATLLFLYLLMPANGQVFQWASPGVGHGWKRGNTIAVDNASNSYIGGEFSAPIDTDGLTFDYPPAGNYLTSQGITDGFIVKYDILGNVQWMLRIGQPAPGPQVSNVTVRSIALTADNTLYVTGECNGNVVFTDISIQGTPIQVLKGSSFIAKYPNVDDASSTALPQPEWVRIIGPVSDNAGKVISNGIAVHVSSTDNKVYVCGKYQGTVSFRTNDDVDDVTDALHATNSRPHPALFLVKYDEAGEPEWVVRGQNFLTDDASTATAVAVTSDGGAVVTGHYVGYPYLDNPITPLTYLTGSPDSTVLILRYNESGANTLATTATLSPQSSALGRSIAVDASDNIYVTGSKSGVISFENHQPPGTQADFFLVKYLSGGGADWVVSGGPGTVDATGNSLTIANDEIYLTGNFSGRIDLEAPPQNGTGTIISLGSLGNHDVFVASYGLNGDIKWAQRAGNSYQPSKPGERYSQGTGIGTGLNGNVHIVGEFGFDINFFRAGILAFEHFRNIFTAMLVKADRVVTGTVYVNYAASKNHTVIVSEASSLHPMTFVTTGPQGNYTAYLPPTGTFLIQALTTNPWVLTIPRPSSTSSYVIGPSTGNTTIQNQDFGFTKTADTHDLRVTITRLSKGYVVAGSRVPFLISYKNLGTYTETNIDITLNIDNPFIYAEWADAPLPSQGDLLINQPTTLAWNIASLSPWHEGQFLIWLDVDPRATGGTPLPLQARIKAPHPIDASPSNNTASIVEIVWVPSDPNGKFVTPQGNLSVVDVRNGMDLTYTIEFFNIGPAVANKVIVYDDLAPGMFQIPSSVLPVIPLSYSPAQLGVTSSSHHVEFLFTPANLQSIYESVTESHGFIRFKARLMDNLSIGTTIANKAIIRFDDQEFIHTNIVENCIASDFTVTGGCTGDSVQFISLTDSGIDYLWDGDQQIFRVQWNFGDGNSSTERNPKHVYAKEGTYNVTLQFTFLRPVEICGILSSNHTVQKSVRIQQPLPQPTIKQDGSTLVTDTAASYQWYREGRAIEEATSQRYKLLSTDTGKTFTVLIGTSAGCQSKISEGFHVKLLEVIPGITQNQDVRITPNPGSGPFIIELDDEAVKEWRLSVIDTRGEMVVQQVVPAGQSIYVLDLDGHPSGVYTARIDLDGKVTTRRFMLVR